MKRSLSFLVLFFVVSSSLFAQNFTGVATYKTDRKMDMKMDSTKVNDAMRQQIMAQLKSQFQKEYTLSFNKEASLYKEEEKLAPPQPNAGGITIEVSGGNALLYHNNKENKYLNQTEIMGKQFLIEDIIEKKDWKLEKETKNIGNYTCFKATYTEEYEDSTFDDTSKDFKKEMKTKTVTAWYTLDIPLPHGPSHYRGLPGFILQVEDGDLTILCSKIVLNPEDGVTIEMPKKGKKVTQAEFDEIQEKKNAEMMERFKDSKSKKGNSDGFEIIIGG